MATDADDRNEDEMLMLLRIVRISMNEFNVMHVSVALRNKSWIFLTIYDKIVAAIQVSHA